MPSSMTISHERLATAFHEIGHGVAAIRAEFWMKYATVDSDSTGHCYTLTPTNEACPKWLRAEASVCLAGQLCEQVFRNGGPRLESFEFEPSVDLNRATGYAGTILALGGNGYGTDVLINEIAREVLGFLQEPPIWQAIEILSNQLARDGRIDGCRVVGCLNRLYGVNGRRKKRRA